MSQEVKLMARDTGEIDGHDGCPHQTARLVGPVNDPVAVARD
jgi:hypothetical protein